MKKFITKNLLAIFLLILAISENGCSKDICPGLAECGGVCVDLNSDSSNCGGCGNICNYGQICVEGVCQIQSCIDECPLRGAIACAVSPLNGPVMCDNYDEDSCLEWGSYSACEGNSVCKNGTCMRECNDECMSSGERICNGNGYQECGQFDNDSCLEWSDVIACEANTTCSEGNCSSTCIDECNEGEHECVSNGSRSCGQYDNGPCLEWSPIENCGDEKECKDGQCVERECLDEYEDCVCGRNQCCEGHCCPVFFICIPWDPQSDWCPNGPGPNA